MDGRRCNCWEVGIGAVNRGRPHRWQCTVRVCSEDAAHRFIQDTSVEVKRRCYAVTYVRTRPIRSPCMLCAGFYKSMPARLAERLRLALQRVLAPPPFPARD